MNNQTEELQLYFNRLRPLYRELFGMAHAICGNCETAEYALQRTILDGWTRHARGRGKVGFREGMRAALKRIAVQEALRQRSEDVEMTWNELGPGAVEADPEDAEANPEEALLLREIQAEDTDMRRMLMLHHGCGLRAQTIARLMGSSAGQVQTQLERFASRTRRKLPARLRRHFEPTLAGVIREALIQTSANVPDPGTVYRTFEVEASQGRRNPRKYLSQAVNAAIFVVLALLCAVVFWLVAVLMQAPEIDAPTGVPAIEQPAGPAWNQG